MSKFTAGHRRSAKLSADQVRRMRELYSEGATQGSLARAFGVSVGQVGRIVRGESWQSYQRILTDQEIEEQVEEQALAAGADEIDTSAALLLEKLRSSEPEPDHDPLEEIMQRRSAAKPQENSDGNAEAAQTGSGSPPAPGSPPTSPDSQSE